MLIREALINDIPELVSLMDQLGYPTSIDAFKLRFEAIAVNPNYHAIVAEIDGKVVGMAGLCTGLFYEYDGLYVRIVAFVVDSKHRGKGLGKKLIQEAESWARKHGAISIGLNSGKREERKKAHQFYFNMGYMLEKGESSDYIYSIDYRSLEEDEKEEYFTFFSSSGWSHVASEADIHLFRAHHGTKPIYTDRDTTVEKYENLSNFMKKWAIPFILLTVLAWIGAIVSFGNVKSFLHVVAVIISVPAIPLAWTVILSYNNKWKVEGRRGLANFVKITPFLIILLLFIAMLFANGSDRALRIAASMVIGAVALPTIIWIIMSRFHKIGGRRT